ncbi:MAG: translation initiation factor IF-2 [Candidatus Omnitrophota bacterium]
MRVHELSKKLNITSKDLIDKLNTLGFSVKGHMSSVPDEAIDRLTKPKIEPPKVQDKPKEDVCIKETVVSSGLKYLELDIPIALKDLSVKLAVKPSILIKKLMDMRIMATLNQMLDEEIITKVIADYGFTVKKAATIEERLLQTHTDESKDNLKPRWPVVTLMGHVDHGKTSLLDAIRISKVADAEHGGITQAIGAYEVSTKRGKITFLDTPGHEAFTAMRARGAKATDIVILVVAADDGVMPQTIEAIDHAKAAEVPIVVAINKIDKPQADVDRIKKQLSEYGLLAEDWGGKTIMVGVSAKTKEGIDNLLEMLLLEAEMLELKANYEKRAQGVVLESKITKGRGPVATVLVQDGTLNIGDMLIAGHYFAKVRAMYDDRGHAVKIAPPATPVEILGFDGTPLAGEQFFVVTDERQAKEFLEKRKDSFKLKEQQKVKKISLDDLYQQIKEHKIKDLAVILKADTQGSLEAIDESLKNIQHPEIKIHIIHKGVGSINTSDVVLASASSAIIIGFNVNIEDRAEEEIKKEDIDVRTYNIIYELIKDIKAALEGLLEPKIKKVFIGRAIIRKVFKTSKAGNVAGCFVERGVINRNAAVSLVRNGAVIYEGKISALKRFKDDVRSVETGFECGISLEKFEDYQENDCIDAFEIQKIARKI